MWELREFIADTRPQTPAGLLASRYGVHVAEIRGWDGPAIEARGDGWLLIGTLDEVRAELEHRAVAG